MSTTIRTLPAGTYTVDPVHSTFGFAVTFNGVSRFRGQFDQVDARLENGALVGTAQVDSVSTPILQLKQQLLAPDFFDAANTPTVSFQSTDIRIAGDGELEVDGELTIRGVTRPVIATGRYAAGTGMQGNEVVGLEIEATIDRRDYGLNWQTPLPGGGEALGWDVTLEVHLQLVKQ
jgi:polyisoprenoid-binding protein YceI